MDPRFESVHSDVDSSFRCIHFSPESFSEDHTWHYHPEYELTWIIRSRGTRFIGDSIRPYSADDLVLLGPGLPHCWHNDPASQPTDTPELIVVQFDKDFLGAPFFQIAEARKLQELLARAQCGLHFPARVAKRIGKLLQDLSAQQGFDRLIHLLEVLGALATAEAVPLASANYRSVNDINPVNRDRIDAIHRYVRQNLDGSISQAEIAHRLGMSAPAFSRFFRAATGHTFVGFVNLLRINEACRLLAGSNLSITEAAMDCGYNNISNFNRHFLALKGMNPTEYRRHSQRLVVQSAQWQHHYSSADGVRHATA